MTIGWWVGNALGIAVVVPLLVWLASRLVRTTREIERYGRDIRDHSAGVADNLASASALADTQALVGEVADRAGRYVTALDRLA